MKIDILCVGKLKDDYIREGVLDYSGRLSRYCKLQIMEVADERTPDEPTDREKELILDKEAARLEKYLDDSAVIIALAIEGKMLSSEELSKKIEDYGLAGKSHLQFVIGGSLGLHPRILARARGKLSFSKMTFPHRLMRLILMIRILLAEQIYRAFKISKHEPYHK